MTPTYNIKDSVVFPAQWYYEVIKNKKSPIDITKKQILRYMNDSKIY